MSESESLVPPKEKKKRKREVATIIFIAGLFLVFTWIQINLFNISSRLPPVHAIFFFGLVNLNIVLILTLFFLIFRNLVKVFVERKGRLVGSSLKSKLIAAFSSFSFVPTILMFLISVFYINSSFDRWFSVKIMGILKDSLEVTSSYYNMEKKKNYHFAHLIVDEIERNSSHLKKQLDEFAYKFSLDAVEYYPELFEKPIVAINKNSRLEHIPEVSLDFLEKGITHRLESSNIHVFGEGNLVRVIVPISNKRKGAIVVSSFVPMYLISKMDDIAATYETFKDLDSLEYPVKSIYMILLVLMTLVILLCATWFGFHLAKGLSVPLESLSEASRQVSQGIYAPVQVLSGSTEINTLVDSFNKMMRDLEGSEKEVKAANQSLRDTLDVLDSHNRYIEVVLSNVSTGVISVDQRERITTVNREAEQLLKFNFEEVRDSRLKDALGANYKIMVESLLEDAKKYKAPSIKKDLDVDMHGELLRLQVTITFLRGDTGEDLGFVLVIEDLTVLANAQRAAAWREVARRIAHEIKNPLTPIKLAAQRMHRKFGDQIDDPAFKESIDTIVSQTDGLKHLVNEFSNFARLPQVKLVDGDINEILKEVFILYSSAHRDIKIEFKPDIKIPNFKFDLEQIRRAIVNLVDNGIGAMQNAESGYLRISSKLDEEMDLIKIEVEDNGSGITAKNLQQVFEPYYSTKEQGTGLGLPIVKKIVEDHHGYIRVYRMAPNGTKFVIELPLTKLKA